MIRHPGKVSAALLAAGGAAALAVGSRTGDISQGNALGLAAYDCCSEGAPLDGGVPYASYSITASVASDINLEVLDVKVRDTQGPVVIEGVFVLRPGFEQLTFNAPEEQVQALLSRYKTQSVSQIGGCDAVNCEVYFAVVSRRIGSDEAGVVQGLDVRYRVDGKEYEESTSFAIGLCLPHSTEDCTELGDDSALDAAPVKVVRSRVV